MCNFSPSAVTGCALLRHSEVVTLFHGMSPTLSFATLLPRCGGTWSDHIISELGHGIHDLLSRTSYTRYHAWRVPVEFGEALSTMLENWCWDKNMLIRMSCHYSRTGQQHLDRWRARHPQASEPAKHISEELVDRIIANRNLNRALQILKQMLVTHQWPR